MTPPSTRPARLVTIFNHRFDRNIPVLERVYGERFPEMLHLVPFYDGDAERVATVYESSHHFQGFLAQAADEIATGAHDHYVFIGDDLALHPSLDQDNLAGALGLDADSGYVKQLRPLSEVSFQWTPILAGVRPFELRCGVEFAGQLPSAEEAWRRAEAHGYPRRHLGPRNLRGYDGRLHPGDVGTLIGLFNLLRARGRKPLPYPLFSAYSDMFVVPASAFAEFARVCGVLAAMGVFVEVAIPTAMFLTCPRVVTEADVRWEGLEIWDDATLDALEQRHDRKLAHLLNDFEADRLYVHPVKLSRWEAAA